MTNESTPPASKKAAPKKPQDRKPKAEDILEAELESNDLLADMPELKAPTRLRLAQRNKIAVMLMDSGLADEDDSEEDDGEDEALDFKNPEHRARVKNLLGLAADIDEFAESIALDPAAYARWAEGKDVDVFLAIFQRYTNASGESVSSAS